MLIENIYQKKYLLVNSETVLALDATSSMKQTIQTTCLIIGEAFQRMYRILKQQKASATIQVKILVYRNYNVQYPLILQSTAFENTPINLKTFLQNVKALGGWRNEAIEVLFQSQNKEEKLDQVILIGDAPANTPQEVIRKRGKFGQDYWIDNGFPITNLDQQMEKFKTRNCPVHSFYLNNGAGFKDYSFETQGSAKLFDIKSPNATNELTNFIVQKILKIVGEKVGNESLATKYLKLYT